MWIRRDPLTGQVWEEFTAEQMRQLIRQHDNYRSLFVMHIHPVEGQPNEIAVYNNRTEQYETSFYWEARQ